MRADGIPIIDVPGLLLQSVAGDAGGAPAAASTGDSVLAIVATVAAGIAAGAVLGRFLARLRDEPSGAAPRDPALGALAMIFFITSGTIGATLATALGLGGDDAEYARLGRGAVGNLAQVACAMAFLLSPLYVRGPRPPMGWPRATGEGVLALLLAIPVLMTVAIAVNAILLLLGRPTSPEVSHETLAILRAKAEILFTVTTLVHVAILVPLAEEAGWRGLLQPAIRSALASLPGGRTPGGRLAPLGSVLATSALFTLVHWPGLPPDGRPAGLAMLFVLSIVLGGLRERTGGLAAPIALHALFNAANVALTVSR